MHTAMHHKARSYAIRLVCLSALSGVLLGAYGARAAREEQPVEAPLPRESSAIQEHASLAPSAVPSAARGLPSIQTDLKEVPLDVTYNFCLVGAVPLASVRRLSATFPDGVVHADTGWAYSYANLDKPCWVELFDARHPWEAGEYSYQLLVNETLRLEYRIKLTQSSPSFQRATPPVTVAPSAPVLEVPVGAVAPVRTPTDPSGPLATTRPPARTDGPATPAPPASLPVVPCATVLGFEPSTVVIGQKFYFRVMTAPAAAGCPPQSLTLISVTSPSGVVDPWTQTYPIGPHTNYSWVGVLTSGSAPGVYTYRFSMSGQLISAPLTLVR